MHINKAYIICLDGEISIVVNPATKEYCEFAWLEDAETACQKFNGSNSCVTVYAPHMTISSKGYPDLTDINQAISYDEEYNDQIKL